jgi:hypothetical protein
MTSDLFLAILAMDVRPEAVIARSESDEAIHLAPCSVRLWIASLRSQ